MGPTLREHANLSGGVIELWQGDITRLGPDVQAIANAANGSLLGGGGVDGAIHRAAGPALLAECETVGGCPTGDARITGAGRLPQRSVIHCVGPVYRRERADECARLLGCAYRAALRLATEAGLTSVAFPSVSTGVYGYPLVEAAPIALGALAEHLAGGHPPRRLLMVLYDPRTFEAYHQVLADLTREGDAQ